jgi:hypothetical protein
LDDFNGSQFVWFNGMIVGNDFLYKMRTAGHIANADGMIYATGIAYNGSLSDFIAKRQAEPG